MSVSISIVTYQSAPHIAACLAGVRAQGDLVEEVLIADNGSVDDTLERVRADHPQARILELGANRGFASAHNANFAAACGAFVLTLNPDVALAPGYLAELVRCLERNPSLGAATGRLVTPGPRQKIDSAGISYSPGRSRFIDRGHGAPPSLYARDEDVFGACAAAALYRRRAVDEIAQPGETPFAERLFMYYEDVDLTWRLRRAGWGVRYCPGAEACHARGGSGASAAFIEYHLIRNRLWVSLRNASPGELLAELPGVALWFGVKVLQSVVRPHLRTALIDQLRGVPASLAERRRAAVGI